jgi:hypothetical protein
MASKTLSPQPGWLVGETIEVFEIDERREPVGGALDSVVVAADSTVTFELDSGKRYLAVDTNGISVQFAILPDPDEGGGLGPETVTVETLAEDSLATLKAVALHDGEAYPTRPVGFASVEWIGPTDPDELSQDGDTWTPTEAPE